MVMVPRAALLRLGLSAPTLLVVAGACTANDDSPRVSIAASLAVPKGVLDKSSKLALSVIEGKVDCDATTGAVTFPEGNAAAREIAKSELEPKSDCSAGARFCGTLQIEKSDATRVFSAVAKASDDSTIAIGCTATKIDQDALPLTIKMYRFIPAADCSDGKLQPTEQCEAAGGANCDAECQSKEILVSTGSGANGTQSGGVGDKANPFFLWPQQNGNAGRFFAYYSDKNAPGTNPLEVGLRALSDVLEPLTSPPALAAAIFLPNDPNSFPPPAVARQQSFPTAAFLQDRYWVAFQDDTGTGTGIDIKMRSADLQLVAGQGPASPIGVNGPSGAGESNIQREPSMATSKGKLYIAWEDAGGGSIAGRTFTPPATLGSQNTLSSGSGNKGAAVAATPNGWAVVWLAGTGVKLRIVNEDGTPGGAEQTVNDTGSVTERPRIASLADGRFAVTWNAGGEIFVQRFDSKGAKLPGDQASPINDVVKDGDQTTPSIAGTPGAGGSYVVAWLDAGTNRVQARMLGGTSGFLFNHVNGQSTEFTASRVEGRTRANPVVTAGGSKPFVAIGWEDKTSPGAGIVVRRFPLPEE